MARQWPTRVVAVAQQLERHRGTLSQGLRDLVQQLVQPQVPWREVLRQFVTRSFGGTRRWLPPARRYVHRQLYLPSRHCDAIDLALAIDSSGSTYGQCHQFIAELGALASSFGRCSLDVLVCNDRLQRRFYLEEDGLQRLGGLHWPWGGGTDFRPVFDELAQATPPTALLYLTDGEGEAPLAPPPYPVLWVLTRDGKAPAPWGEVVRMDD